MKIIAPENWQEKIYVLNFKEMLYDKTTYGETLSLFFEFTDDNEISLEAILVLTPSTNINEFKDIFKILTSKDSENFKPSPDELKKILETNTYKGLIKENRGILIIDSLEIT